MTKTKTPTNCVCGTWREFRLPEEKKEVGLQAVIYGAYRGVCKPLWRNCT